MKHFTLTLLTLCLSIYCLAQEIESDEAPFNDNFWDHISFTLKTGTPSFAINNLGNSGSDLLNIGIAEIGSAYKVNSKLSVGISLMGGLGNCLEGYFDTEGNFVEIDDDDDDDLDDEGEDDDDDSECESEIEALMATVSYVLSDEIPVFIQGSLGYSIDDSVPAYSVMVGYYKEVFSQLSISGGIRFSETLIKVPNEALGFQRSGIKAELGLHWNF